MIRTKFLWMVQSIALLVVAFAFPSKSSAEWKEKVLYSFQGNTDGATPIGSVVFDKQGNLYGATQDGGAATCPSVQQCGTVYQLTPPAQKGDPWTETVLYVFQGKNNNSDGASPYGGLVIDSLGNLYGTTGYGGTGNCVVLGVRAGCGTVFELSPPQQKGGAWTETILYNFQSGSDGYVPRGDLTVDSAGNIYGATEFGGGFGGSNNCDNAFYAYCGTIFELSPPQKKGQPWMEKVLHSFSGLVTASLVGDGANPVGGLVLDSNGAIYGTTNLGGLNCPHSSNWGCGTVFKLAPPTKKNGIWSETVLHRFLGDNDGANPAGGLTLCGINCVYGTTWGTVFHMVLRTRRWEQDILYTFEEEAFGPQDTLILLDGALYGTTSSSDHFSGTAFRLVSKSGAWTLDILYGFPGPPNGAQPTSRLVLKGNRNWYSTTEKGGTGACTFGCGTVFKTTP